MQQPAGAFVAAIVILVWIVMIAWVVHRVFFFSPPLPRDTFASAAASWISEDPCNAERVPTLEVREATLRILNEHLKSSSYFLPGTEETSVRIDRAWSRRELDGALQWRVEVSAYVLDRLDVETGGARVRLELLQRSGTEGTNTFELATAPVLLEQNLTTDRVLLGDSEGCTRRLLL
jgi:hypothetical protein